MNLPRPKKSLGQNFLIDGNYQEKIIQAIGVSPYILEIGPGRGAITQHLAKTAKKLVLVEKDSELFEYLTQMHASHPQVECHHADFLEWDLELLGNEGPYDVVSNLPYNVATPIFFKLVKARKKFRALYLMFQKEVGLRFVAQPSTKDYGLLTLWAGVYADTKICFHLPKTVFFPPPKVASSFVSFQLKTKPLLSDVEAPKFFELMRILFQNRRKMIRSVLKGKRDLLPDWLPENARAEAMHLGELIRFFRDMN